MCSSVCRFPQQAELSHSQWEKITSAVDWLTGAASRDPQASASLCLDICRVRGRPLWIPTSLFYCQTSWFDENFLSYSGLILEPELNFTLVTSNMEHPRVPERHDRQGAFPGRVWKSSRAASEHIQKEFRKEHDSEIPAEALQDRDKQHSS